MKYVSFPSIDSCEVWVWGHYLYKQEAGKEYLVSFSENKGNILKIIDINLAISQKFFIFL